MSDDTTSKKPTAGAEKRLYGLPDAEQLYDDPATVWETDIEPDITGPGKEIIEEWTVHDPIHHLPDVDQVIDDIYEWATERGEVTECWADAFPLADEAVRAAAANLLTVIAERIPYHMAGEKVAEHTLEWVGDEDGENPLFDGEPMYGKSPTSQE